MKKTILLLSWAFLVLSTTSCFKEDEKILPHQPGNTIIDTITLTNSYKYQAYYDLESSVTVQSDLRKRWDLGFESTPSGLRIRLNTSCFMYAASIGNQTFGQPADTTAAEWKFDDSNGNNESTAIGNWFSLEGTDTVSNGNLYLINCGIDEGGNPRGFRQLVIDSLSGGVYYFRAANFDGSNPKNYSLEKQAGRNYIHFSFREEYGCPQEPEHQGWDLLFTQYTTLLYTDLGEPYPYLVTGVLINPLLVEVAADTIHPFDAITYETASSLDFSSQQDFIGYNWKYYDFDTGSYTVKLDKIYIIRNRDGFLFKLRFLGFYNEKGEKGFPTIEYQRL